MKKQDISNVAGTSPSLNLSSANQSNFPLPGDADQSITIPVQGGYDDMDIAIGIKCANIPVGSMVAFACSGTPALSTPVDTNWMTVTTPDYCAMARLVMPFGFSGILTIRYRPVPGMPLPQDARIAPVLELVR